MKKEELYELLGEVDESYVKGAEEPMKKEVRPVWTRLGAIAAMLALMLCSGTVGPWPSAGSGWWKYPPGRRPSRWRSLG